MNNIINLEQFKPKFVVIDTECIKGFWSLQYRNESMDKAKIITCICDLDFHRLYKKLMQSDKAFYHYSIDYDNTMINWLCKLVEGNQTDINQNLKNLNDLIMKGFKFFRVNAEFWSQFNKSGKNWDLAIAKTKGIYENKVVDDFLDNYPHLLGKSKLFKKLTFNSIPKQLYYYNIKSDGSLVPSVSLKKLQLVEEGYNIKYDFSFNTAWDDMSKSEQDTFIKYSLNDCDFLFRFFEKNCLSDIEKRWWAYKATSNLKQFKILTNRVLYSENNTNLIVELLELPQKHHIEDIDYTSLIHTGIEKFDNFIKFVNEHKQLKDHEIKNLYCSHYELNYLDDDVNVVDGNKIDVKIGSFDTIKIADIDVKFGFGGCHGAIKNYKASKLIHLDYASQYPSIILQNKKLFSKIINVDLYEEVYKLRLEAKKDKDNKVSKLIEQGLKLILNSVFGLINSMFNIPIANKTLGRFICLKGQELTINLVQKILKHNPYCKIVNVNTDGIMIECVPNEDLIFDNVDDGYYSIGEKEIEDLIQKDVNNYLHSKSAKGIFNPKLKKLINTGEKLSQNIINAINLLKNKEVEILPIYFGGNKFKIDLDKVYYLSKHESSFEIIKYVAKPLKLGIENQTFRFTNDIKLASFSEYHKFAEITKNKILEFTLEDTKPIKYFETYLNSDNELNIKLKNKTKRLLYKLIDKSCIGLTGFKGDVKKDSWFKKPIGKMAQYTMTEIQNSTYCKGYTLYSQDKYLIIDVDILDKKTNKAKLGWEICKPFLKQLSDSSTMEVWNTKTKGYNKKFIFKFNPNFQLPDQYKNYIEIIDKGVIWGKDAETEYFNNMNSIKELLI